MCLLDSGKQIWKDIYVQAPRYVLGHTGLSAQARHLGSVGLHGQGLGLGLGTGLHRMTPLPSFRWPW